MLTESVSPASSSPVSAAVLGDSSGASRRAEARQKRREAAAPYTSRHGKVADEDEDEDATGVEFYGQEAPAPRAAGSLFSRLVSYFPIVGKLVGEEEEHEEGVYTTDASEKDAAPDAMDTTENDVDATNEGEDGSESDEGDAGEQEEEQQAEETVDDNVSSEQEEVEVEVEVEEEEEAGVEAETETAASDAADEEMAPPSPVTRAAPTFTQKSSKKKKTRADEVMGTPKRQPLSMVDSPVAAAIARHERAASRDRNVEKKSDLSPVVQRPQRKRNEQRAFLPGPSQKSKMLRISSSQRRRKSSSPAPADSALAVIKQKKRISYDEYERLAHQLRELVEPTPQAALALTQSALAEGLDREKALAASSYVPGSIANQTNGALTVQDVNKQGKRDHVPTNGAPFGKRARTHENRPIFFSGASAALRGQTLTREERLERKPRPSRLLTGAKRDAAARSAYSAAVAEKILSTLNKVQTPLEREARKPTPSTSLSWAKYHLAIVDDKRPSAHAIENGKKGDEVPPPTATVPSVAFPQVAAKPAMPAALSFGSAANLPTSGLQTPSAKSKAVGMTTGGVTPLFSPQTVSMTPAAAPKLTAAQLTTTTTTTSTGQFKFTLPIAVKKTRAQEEDGLVQFMFSPPPTMREPPVKAPGEKTVSKAKGGAAPFSFMPGSPKATPMEWVSKPKEVAKPTPKKPAVPKEGEKSSTTGSASVSGAANPLEKFMQLKPGQWKCPGCSVVNEGKSAKCPCCETAKPAGTAPAPTKAAPTGGSVIADGATNPLAKFMQLKPGQWKCPGCSVVNEKKHSKCPCCETANPAGATPTKAVEAPKTAGAITSGGFSFGAPATDAKKDAEKPAAAITSGGFSFGAPVAAEKKGTEKPAASITSGGFSFGAPVAAEKKGTDKPVSGGFTFAAPTPASTTKTTDVPSGAAISFGFTAPAKTDDTKSAATNGFSFGAPATGDKEAEKPVPSSSFSFGAPKVATPAVATSEASGTGGFTFGSTSSTESRGTGKRKALEAETSQKDSSPSFGLGASTSAAKPSTSTGFSFGAAPEAEKASPKESDRPKKRVAPTVSKPDASKTETKAPAFGFGAATTSAPSFTFGDASKSSAEKPKDAAQPSFSFSTPPESKAKETATPSTGGFSFGASSTPAAKPNAGFGQDAGSKAPAFGFGASKSTSPSIPAAKDSSSSPGFTFGQADKKAAAPAAPAAPTTTFGFGAPSTAAPTTTSASATSSQVQAAPAFTFGSGKSTPPTASSGFGSSSGSTTFGQTPASSSSGFGSSSTTTFGAGVTSGFGAGTGTTSGFGSSTTAPSATFGAPGASASTGPAFSFGASSQTPATSAAAPAAGQPSFSFGASQAPASTGFGAAPSTGFGATAATGGFGSTPSPAFGASASTPPAFGTQAAPAAPAFGSQAAPAAPAFGTSLPPPSTTFGASGPAFGAPAGPSGGFGSGPASSGFRTPSPTPSAFGGAQNTAPAFGAGSNSGFGAGAAAPAAGGFGAPAGGAFGAPASGGFNMGAAPQHAKGRRILKPRSRTRRT